MGSFRGSSIILTVAGGLFVGGIVTGSLVISTAACVPAASELGGFVCTGMLLPFPSPYILLQKSIA